MAYENVTITVSAGAQPLSGVYLRIYRNGGPVAAGTTNGAGTVTLLLPTGVPYIARMYKEGYELPPESFEAEEDADNVFFVLASKLEPGAPPQPWLTQFGGVVVTPSGTPAAGARFNLVLLSAPNVEGVAVINERTTVKADATGRVCFSLMRCGLYSLTSGEGLGTPQLVLVPNAPSADAGGFLNPSVRAVSVENMQTFVVGTVQPLHSTVIMSSGAAASTGVLGGPTVAKLFPPEGKLVWESDDPSVLAVANPLRVVPVVTGVSPGTARVTAYYVEQDRRTRLQYTTHTVQ